MRRDIEKVICTPARVVDRYADKEAVYRRHEGKDAHLVHGVDADGEFYMESNAQRRGSMSRRAKFLSDFLAPLRGWARKSIGRPYDLVWSELSRHLQGNGVLQRHVKEHAREMIVPPNMVEIRDGRAFHRPEGRWFRSPLQLEIECGELYADPRDGIVKFGKGSFGWKSRYLGIRSNPKKASKKTSPPKSVFDKKTKQTAILVDGTWYWQVDKTFSTCFWGGGLSPFREKMETIHLHQLASKDLRRLGLHNAAG